MLVVPSWPVPPLIQMAGVRVRASRCMPLILREAIVMKQ